MNTKIKIVVFSVVALFGLFVSFNGASAQTVVTHCDSATMTGTVYPNGSATQAWFNWGPSSPPTNQTSQQTFYTTSTYSATISPLSPSTHYFYQAVAQNAGGTAKGAVLDFYTPACAVSTYTVTANAGTGGSISPSSTVVNSGSTTSFNVVPNSRYSIGSVSGCNGNLSGNTYTTGAITSNCTVTANFTQNVPTTYTVSTNAGIGGVISPGSLQVNSGNTATFQVIPNTGYVINTAYGCSGTLSGGTFVTGPITSNCTITANFTQNPVNYTVSTNAGIGGVISPGSQQVSSGNTATFQVIPNTGYVINTAYGCSGTLSGGTFATGPITSNCTITANFTLNAPLTYTVSTNAGVGGYISPSSTTVNSGSTAVFSVNPNNGYYINSVSGCNGNLSGNTYTTGAITSNCTVTANFTQNAPTTYTVSTNAGVGGYISPSSTVVNSGSTAVFSITPNGGYTIGTVSGCNGNLSGNTYTTGAIYNNCTVSASFNYINNNLTYTVSTNASAGGYISPSSTVVNSGSTAVFTVSPNSGYTIGSVSGCNGNLSGNTYTTGAIYNNCTVAASFNYNNNSIPSVTTNTATNIGTNYATLNGYVTSNGSTSVNAWFEWGIGSYYGTQTNQTNYGITNTSYSYYLSGLNPNTTYYYRAVAQSNNGQIVYGNQMLFMTTGSGGCTYNCYGNQPIVTTYSATGTTDTYATLNGYVDPNGSYATRWFNWGTSYGSLYSTTNRQSQGTYAGNFSDSISNLTPNTYYYFQAAAQGSNGQVIYGNVLSFITTNGIYNNTCNNNTTYYNGYNNYNNNNINCAPTAVTTIVSNVTTSSARLSGLGLVNNNINTNGYFEYGTTQGLGLTTTSQSIGSAQSSPFYQTVSNLPPSTIYYYRAVVTNQYGTSRGDILSFRTLDTNYNYDNTNTNTNTTTTRYIYRNATVVSNTNTTTGGTSRPSLVFLTVSRDGETIGRGDTVEYVVNYKNVSSKNLQNIVLQILIPREFQFMETSRGYFSTADSTVVVNVGNLNPQEEGSVSVTVKVTTDAQLGKIVVVTANLAYTVIDNNNNNSTQEEVFAYSKNTIEEDNGQIQQGALAFLFGGGFLPNSLLGWLLLILLIVLLILAARKAYYGPTRTMIVSDHPDNNHH